MSPHSRVQARISGQGVQVQRRIRSPAPSQPCRKRHAGASVDPLGRDILPSHLRMAVPPRCPQASPRVRWIIVGLDFSAECDDALKSLAAVAAGTDVMLELVYVIDVFTETFVQSNGRRRRDPFFRRKRSSALCATDCRSYALLESGALAASSSGCRRWRSRAMPERTAADLVVLGSRHRECHSPPTWVGSAATRLFRDPAWRRLQLRPRSNSSSIEARDAAHGRFEARELRRTRGPRAAH